ncbi:MAG: hypothetical protein ACKVH1_15630 [Alphaproteobacteria bacterium]|jgi:anti-sigma factor RsiW
MTISDEKLLAYADGLLTPAEIDEIDRLFADDADARETLAALKQSDLPYREAAETLIDVPDLSHLAAPIQWHQPPRDVMDRYNDAMHTQTGARSQKRSSKPKECAHDV